MQREKRERHERGGGGSHKRGAHKEKEKISFNPDSWRPRTDVGKRVKLGEIKSIDELLDNGIKILEPEIVDMLLPGMESDIILAGQSKGKFGGGKRTIWRQSQKKTAEGNKPKFSAIVIVGNKDGYVGMGLGKAKETMPAKEKAMRQAKMNIIKIRRACGSWECECSEPHSIPFKVKGRCGSVCITLFPAPKGANLKVEKECQKVLELAGLKDVYSKTFGQTRTRLNTITALFEALRMLCKMKVQPDYMQKAGVVDGRSKEAPKEQQ